LIDLICEEFFSAVGKEEWFNPDELSEILKNRGLEKTESKNVMTFMKRYFLIIDKKNKKAKLNSWSYNLFKIPKRNTRL